MLSLPSSPSWERHPPWRPSSSLSWPWCPWKLEICQSKRNCDSTQSSSRTKYNVNMFTLPSVCVYFNFTYTYIIYMHTHCIHHKLQGSPQWYTRLEVNSKNKWKQTEIKQKTKQSNKTLTLPKQLFCRVHTSIGIRFCRTLHCWITFGPIWPSTLANIFYNA